MTEGADLAAMLPHAGAMVMLERVISWDAGGLRCATTSHLRADNPLRREGQLAAICGVEYALQAAALHGALLAGGVPQRAGYVARLREVVLNVERLDDIAGELLVEAVLERQEANGMLYGLRVSGGKAQILLTGRASIALPA